MSNSSAYSHVPANMRLRYRASIIDSVIFGMLYTTAIILFFVTDFYYHQETGDYLWISMTSRKINLLIFLAHCVWQSIFIASPWQGTPGKRITGLIVVYSEDFDRVSFGRALFRSLTWYLSVTFHGFSRASADELHRTLHDKLAGTLVFQKNIDYKE